MSIDHTYALVLDPRKPVNAWVASNPDVTEPYVALHPRYALEPVKGAKSPADRARFAFLAMSASRNVHTCALTGMCVGGLTFSHAACVLFCTCFFCSQLFVVAKNETAPGETLFSLRALRLRESILLQTINFLNFKTDPMRYIDVFMEREEAMDPKQRHWIHAIGELWHSPLKHLKRTEKGAGDWKTMRIEMLWASGRSAAFDLVFKALLGGRTCSRLLCG